MARVAETLSAAIDLAKKITVNAPVREAVRLVREFQTMSDEEGCRLMDQANTRVMATEDFKEGPLAFVQKRQPHWTGR